MIPQKKINNEFWLVKKNKEPLTLAVERLLPANALFRCLHFLEWTSWRHEKRMKYEPKMKTCNWNHPIRKFVNYDLSSFEFLNSVGAKIRKLQCERPPGIEISWERTSNAATKNNFNVALLFGTLRQHARSNYIIATNGISWKTLRFGAKRHLRIWSLKFKKSLNLF